jgi:uncharacterized protein (TIGR03067 family)
LLVGLLMAFCLCLLLLAIPFYLRARLQHAPPRADTEAAETRNTPSIEELRRRFDGAWRVISVRIAGKETLPAGARRHFQFQNGDLTLLDEATQETTKAIIILDPTTKPKALDIIRDPASPTGSCERLIYYVRDGQLHLARNAADPSIRPRGFVSAAGNNIEVTTLERIPSPPLPGSVPIKTNEP